MRRTHLSLAVLALVGGAVALPSPAHAISGYYTSDCSGCHGTTSTCNGCHRHGATNVAGSISKTTFAPGETMAITVTAGTRSGWWRAAVVDQAGAVVQTASVASGLSATISVPAPDAPGTYAWRVAWYGNERGGSGGATWSPDPGNPNHGYRLASLAAFTVEAPQAPAPSATLTATALDFGNVTVGQLESRTAAVGNVGNADLAVTAVAPCANTAPPFGISPSAAFSVTPGGTQVLTVTFAPTSTGAASGCFQLATNDPVQPTLTVTVTGAGTALPVPSATLTPASLPFGSVTVGQSSTLTATVGNTGSATLSVSGVTPCDSSNSAAFTVSPTAAFTVAAGVTQALTVRFAPTVEGAASACFDLATNDPARATLRLTATGTGAAVPPPPPPPPTSTCGTCHAIPPATGRHSLHQSEGYGCSRCHGTGYSSTTVNAATHDDGTKNVVTTIGWNPSTRSCSNSCHGTESWGGTVTPPPPPPPTGSCTTCHGIPPSTGEHAQHDSEGYACSRCHGTGYSDTTVNATTHQDGVKNLVTTIGWNGTSRSCSNSCHGTESWGGTVTPPPPPTGTCGSCHAIPPSTGQHSDHRSEGISCSRCHGTGYSSTTVNPATHDDGTTNVATTIGWNATSRSCSNSCHGTESWGGTGTTPPPTTSCGSCHPIPPASGQHADHRSDGIGCSRCHGTGYSDTTVNSATHADGTTNIASGAGWSSATRSCSNSCHGSESWGSGSGGDDGDDEECDEDDDDCDSDDSDSDDGDDLAVTAGSGAAGGCSSAGGSVTMLAFAGIAALAARRRRSAPRP